MSTIETDSLLGELWQRGYDGKSNFKALTGSPGYNAWLDGKRTAERHQAAKQAPRLVTHVESGVQYIHIGTAHGAGHCRGENPLEVYRSVEDGRLWYRLPADFANRMKP